jgi:hypothetical protein
VRWGDGDGTNWIVELVGLPAPHRCLEAVDAIATELRTKYRLAKDRLSRADLAAVLMNETFSELGLGWRPVPPPPRPTIKMLPDGINVAKWTAAPSGPVSLDYMLAFNRALARLQRQTDLEV